MPTSRTQLETHGPSPLGRGLACQGALIGLVSLVLLGGCEEQKPAPAAQAPPVVAQATPHASPAPRDDEPSSTEPAASHSAATPSLGKVPTKRSASPDPIPAGSADPEAATAFSSLATAQANPDVPLGPDGEAPTGEALEKAKLIVAKARGALRAPIDVPPSLSEELFAPAFDHYGPALDLRGQFFHLRVQHEGAKGNSTAWYRRAKAYGFMPGLPERESGWRYQRLAAYGLSNEVMESGAAPHSAEPAFEGPARPESAPPAPAGARSSPAPR